jgi:hypothetical protein
MAKNKNQVTRSDAEHYIASHGDEIDLGREHPRAPVSMYPKKGGALEKEIGENKVLRFWGWGKVIGVVDLIEDIKKEKK